MPDAKLIAVGNERREVGDNIDIALNAIQSPPDKTLLDADGAKLYQEVQKIQNALHKNLGASWIKEIDRVAFLAYCYSYQQWRRVVLQIEGLRKGGKEVFLVEHNGTELRINPLINLEIKLRKAFLQAANEMALMPTTRLKIAAVSSSGGKNKDTLLT